MVEKIQFQKILKNLRLFVKNHSCIATSRPLPGSQQLPLVLQTTPLAPQVPPGSTPIDGGGILLFLDFRHFRPLASRFGGGTLLHCPPGERLEFAGMPSAMPNGHKQKFSLGL